MTRRLPAPPPRWFLAGLALLSLLAAVVVARISGPDGPWLWNLDMPKMTMAFRVRDPKWLDTLKEGERIRFAADNVNGTLTVVAYEPWR